MKKNTQKFMHYAFMTLLYSMMAGTAGLIIFTMVVAFQNL